MADVPGWRVARCSVRHTTSAPTPREDPYAIERYTSEGGAHLPGAGQRLSEEDYLAGEYSIADMAVFPWIRLHERQGQDMADYPHLSRWFDTVAARPAVAKDMEKTRDVVGTITDETWDNLWGKKQFQRR